MKKSFVIVILLFLFQFSICAAETTPPSSFSIVYPSAEAVIDTLGFGWTASYDGGSGLAQYGVFIDGTLRATVEPTDLSTTLSDSLPDGSHTVYIEAKDFDGNSTQTSSRRFYINANGPTYEVSADGSVLSAGDTIRRLPIISVKFVDPIGIDTSTIQINVDGAVKTATLEVLSSFETHVTSCRATFKINSALDRGTHIINASSTDRFGELSSITIAPLYVLGTVSVSGIAKNYPNPFKPLQSQITKIAYTLSEDGNITILIYDISGNPIKKLTAAAGAESSPGLGLGGREGYNEVDWDGKSDFGSTVGNGIYPYLIVSEGRVISTGQVAVYD